MSDEAIFTIKCAGCATPLIWIEGVWKHKEGPFIMAYYASHVATPVEGEA